MLFQKLICFVWFLQFFLCFTLFYMDSQSFGLHFYVYVTAVHKDHFLFNIYQQLNVVNVKCIGQIINSIVMALDLYQKH